MSTGGAYGVSLGCHWMGSREAWSATAAQRGWGRFGRAHPEPILDDRKRVYILESALYVLGKPQPKKSAVQTEFRRKGGGLKTHSKWNVGVLQ